MHTIIALHNPILSALLRLQNFTYWYISMWFAAEQLSADSRANARCYSAIRFHVSAYANPSGVHVKIACIPISGLWDVMGASIEEDYLFELLSWTPARPHIHIHAHARPCIARIISRIISWRCMNWAVQWIHELGSAVKWVWAGMRFLDFKLSCIASRRANISWAIRSSNFILKLGICVSCWIERNKLYIVYFIQHST